MQVTIHTELPWKTAHNHIMNTKLEELLPITAESLLRQTTVVAVVKLHAHRYFIQSIFVTAVLFVLCACRTFSENDCTMVAPADPCLSPTKGELVYSKTAKQCLEEISGTAGPHTHTHAHTHTLQALCRSSFHVWVCKCTYESMH